MNSKTGSHNLIVGKQHNYSGYGGIVVGLFNTISGGYASPSAGANLNTASGYVASVSGGDNNNAAGEASFRQRGKL